MPDVFQEIRWALRSLRRRPGFTVVVVATLALGMGANVAIFSVIDAVLLRPLPYPEPDRLVRLFGAYPSRGETRVSTSPLDLDDWRAQSTVFEALAGVPSLRMSGLVVTDRGEPEELETSFVTEGFFETLKVPPVVGRTLEAEDQVEGRNRVAVLGYGAWQRRFGGSPSAVGSTLVLNGDPYLVAGVMPEGFDYPSAATELWVPLSLIPDSGVPRLRQVRWLQVVGRLRERASIEDARAELATIAARLAEAHPDTNEGLTAVTVRPLSEVLVRDVRAALLTLFGGVGLVLLIACANVSNLVLARSEARRQEIAIRAALGAGRKRLARGLLVESLLLALAGGGLGLALAFAGVRALLGLAPANVPGLDHAGVDGTAIAFTGLVAGCVTLLFGLAPALRASRLGGLDTGPRLSSERSSRRFRSGLVVAELTLVVLLSIAAGLLLRSYSSLLSVDPGYDPERLLTLAVTAQTYKYPEREDYRRFFRRVREALAEVPGVDSVGMVRPFPLRGDTFEGEDFDFVVAGRPRPSSGGELEAVLRFTAPGYFRTMGIPLLAGRDFTEDDLPDRGLVVVVNHTASERYWPGESPVGSRILVGEAEATVVGVVGDVRQTELGAAPTPAVYATYTQVSRAGMTFVLRTRGEPLAVARAAQEAIWRVEPDQPISQVATMEQVIEGSLARQRFALVLLVGFAALALALAAVGVYGVTAHAVSRETRAIGIRMAMGARPRDVVRLVLRRGLALAAGGLALGLLAAFAITRVLESQLFGVTARDPLTFAAVTVLLGAVALAASLVPALRAGRIHPLAALRYE